MKKLFLVLAATLLAASLHAQVGVVAGLTSSESNIRNAVENASNVNQFHLGMAMKFDLGLLAIQPELLYNVKGQTIESMGSDGLQTTSFKTGYIELPVQLQLGVKLGKIIRPYAFAEPFLGYAVTNESFTLAATSYPDEKKDKWKNTWDNVKTRTEFGLSLGFGADLFQALQISLKYFWNFGTIYGNESSFSDLSRTVTEGKCNGIAASLAIFF